MIPVHGDDDVGFEDAQMADGFAAGLHVNHQPIVQMTNGNTLFNRFGGINAAVNGNSRGDEIKLDLLKIQKKIDVKKLKHQLWTCILPKVEDAPGKPEKEMNFPK